VADFLLELLSEEIPARMQEKARADLARLFGEQLSEAGLVAEAIETYATPRRLALVARGLPEQTDAASEEIKGPRTTAPPQALEGFLRKTGLAQDQLVERDGIWFASVERPGRATAEILAEAIPEVIRAFPWSKSMRWGEASVSTESIRWVRPLQGIVALFGEEVVEFEIAGIKSGAATVGHRFHHPGTITLGGAGDYVEKMRVCHVIVDQEERKEIIRKDSAKLQRKTKVVPDEALVAENAGLTEWPVPLKGDFDAAFLALPPELIQLTMRVNQKYFACQDEAGNLSNRFVFVANIASSDPEAVIAGNEKVLAARLADAKFFWEQDVKVPLAEQAARLGQIVFHEKLGTVADKVERVAKLARWLVEEGIVGSNSTRGAKPVIPAKAGISLLEGKEIPASAGMTDEFEVDAVLAELEMEEEDSRRQLADLAETAARLAKADLVTGLVGEFPELQGVIGGHIARAQGQLDAIADAIRDHYKPVGQGDDVPTAPVTVAVSLADKLDTIASFFEIGEKPSGSKDPFALRRAALGVGRLVLENGIRLKLLAVMAGRAGIRESDARELLEAGFMEAAGPNLRAFAQAVGKAAETLQKQFTGFLQSLAFFAERLKVQLREAGVRHDLIDAVFALGDEDDLVRLIARAKALQAFVETAEGADLLAGYKRAANILKKERWPPGSSPAAEQQENKPLSYTPEKEEAALIAALDSAEPKAAAAIEAEDFEGAMAALASLRAPVDAFFDKVIVNDPDPAKREVRLNLLARMRDAVHRVADFSRIEG